MKVDCPQQTWSLDKLGEFCQETSKRAAIDAWRVGRALLIAKEKCPHGKWMEWRGRNCPGFSKETLSRWQRLAENVNEPDLLEGLTLQKSYSLVFINGGNEPETKTRKLGNNGGNAKPKEGDEPTPSDTKSTKASSAGFLADKIIDKLKELEGLPQKDRWAGADDLRAKLVALKERIDWALTDLPKTRRKK